MMTQTYAGKFLSLKPRVICVTLTIPGTNPKKAVGKVLHLGRKAHFRTNNSTAAHLLYLLSRPEDDEISFEQMIELITTKYNNISAGEAESKLNDFLNDLDSLYNKKTGILDVKKSGTETDDPDPCNLFTGPTNTDNWDPDPKLDSGNPPDSKDSHFYACGNAITSFRR